MKKIAKRHLILTIIIVLSLSCGISANAATTKQKAMTTYAEYLKKQPAKSSLGKVMFGIAYIDNNSVPELITRNAEDIPFQIFTYKNGKMKKYVGTVPETECTYYSNTVANRKKHLRNSASSIASIKLNKTSAAIYKGSSVTLKATVTGASQKVSWSSSNKKIAVVKKNGTVVGKKKGTVTITAKANGKTAKCKITVKKPSIKLNQTQITINKGKSVRLTAFVNGPDSKVTWKSRNKKIASINSNGVVTAKKAGTITITAKANGVTAKCKITVKEQQNKKILLAKNEYRKFLEQQTKNTKFCIMEISGIDIPILVIKYENGIIYALKYDEKPEANSYYDYVYHVKLSSLAGESHKLYINPKTRRFIQNISFDSGEIVYNIHDYNRSLLTMYRCQKYSTGRISAKYRNGNGDFINISYDTFCSMIQEHLSGAMLIDDSMLYLNTPDNRKKYLE